MGTPTPKNWDYRRHNGVSDYAAKKKLPFLDMNLLEKELNMDWDRDSRDEGDHLNTYDPSAHNSPSDNPPNTG